jgi:hypothetical protein
MNDFSIAVERTAMEIKIKPLHALRLCGEYRY